MRVRTATAIVVIALLSAACGDGGGGGSTGSDGGSGSAVTADPARTASFCDAVRDLQNGSEGLDIGDPVGLATFERLIADAPAKVQDDLNAFVDQTKRFEDLDEDDPSSIGAAYALFFDPAFIEAIQGFGTFLQDECDIEVPGLDDLADFDPDQLQQDLSDLDGELDDLQDQLDGATTTSIPG